MTEPSSAPHPSDAMARSFADELARRGVSHVFASPGSRSAPLARAFLEHPAIKLHVVLDERSAAFAALGSAKAMRRPSAVICTSGTAAANFHPAVLEAHHSSTPLLVLTADRPPELKETGAGQTTDQTKLYGSAVRWFFDLGVAEDADHSESYFRSVAARAHGYSVQRKGPVHLNISFREPLTPPLAPAGSSKTVPSTEVDVGRAVLTDEQVSEVAAMLSWAKRPLLVAGSSGADPHAVASLARRAGWPLIAEITSGARRDGAISCYEAMLRTTSFAEGHLPDAVLRIGDIGISKLLPDLLSQAATQVVVSDGWMWSDPERSATKVIVADPTALCSSLAKVLGPLKDPSWAQSWAEAEAKARLALDAAIDAQGLTEPRIARDLMRSIPSGGTVVVGSSMPVRDLEWFAGNPGDVAIVANRGVNGIDGLVSTAAGVAASKGGPVIAFTGDIGMIHDSNGLQTASAADVDLTVVVINNDGGGIFSFLPHAEHSGFEELFGTPHQVDMELLAGAYGWEHSSVRDANELVRTLRSCMGSGRTLIEAKTNRAANVEDHRSLWRAVSDSLGR